MTPTTEPAEPLTAAGRRLVEMANLPDDWTRLQVLAIEDEMRMAVYAEDVAEYERPLLREAAAGAAEGPVEHVNVVAIGEAATSALDELDNIRWDDIWAGLIEAGKDDLAAFAMSYVSYVRDDIQKVIAELVQGAATQPDRSEGEALTSNEIGALHDPDRWYEAFIAVTGDEAHTPEGRAAIYRRWRAALARGELRIAARATLAKELDHD
jgi:hypothetical protein